MRTYERYVASRPGIKTNVAILGYGFAGAGPNVATAFTVMKDWKDRNGATVADEIAHATEAAKAIPEGTVMSLSPRRSMNSARRAASPCGSKTAPIRAMPR